MKMTADSVLVVIPARYPSTRFPGKPLADLNGKPMIRRVWEGAMAAKRPNRVLVATDDERIAQVVRGFGAEVMMTSSSHRTGTERVAQVAAQFPAQRVMNLQGDLPLFQPATLDRLIEIGGGLIQSGEADLITAKSAVTNEEEVFSPHSVKVVTNERGEALYFSRSPIPYIERGEFGKMRSFTFYKHYGIYLYHKDFLLRIAESSEGDLERMERLEQLRVLEQGGRVRVLEIEKEEARFFWEVNTPEDLVKAREILDTLNVNRYT